MRLTQVAKINRLPKQLCERNVKTEQLFFLFARSGFGIKLFRMMSTMAHFQLPTFSQKRII